jgi:hypothetical protein
VQTGWVLVGEEKALGIEYPNTLIAAYCIAYSLHQQGLRLFSVVEATNILFSMLIKTIINLFLEWYLNLSLGGYI